MIFMTLFFLPLMVVIGLTVTLVSNKGLSLSSLYKSSKATTGTSTGDIIVEKDLSPVEIEFIYYKSCLDSYIRRTFQNLRTYNVRDKDLIHNNNPHIVDLVFCNDSRKTVKIYPVKSKKIKPQFCYDEENRVWPVPEPKEKQEPDKKEENMAETWLKDNINVLLKKAEETRKADEDFFIINLPNGVNYNVIATLLSSYDLSLVEDEDSDYVVLVN